MIIQASQLLMSPVALIFCGHLGNAVQLDGAALAISVSTRDRDRFRYSWLLGFCTPDFNVSRDIDAVILLLTRNIDTMLLLTRR